MKTIISILSIVALLAVSGCGANVRTYTFQKERPDQELLGNRGYLKGTPPPSERPKKAERTFVGVDVELPTGKEFIKQTGLKFPRDND